MNPLFERLMRKATLLTHGGNLEEATRAIQRALAGSSATPGAAEPPVPKAADHDERLVVDVERAWSSPRCTKCLSHPRHRLPHTLPCTKAASNSGPMASSPTSIARSPTSSSSPQRAPEALARWS